MAALAFAHTRVNVKGAPAMKVVLWIIGIIFLVGLLVLLGLGKLIF